MAMLKRGLILISFFIPMSAVVNADTKCENNCDSVLEAKATVVKMQEPIAQPPNDAIDIDALIADGAGSVLCEMGERSRLIVLDSPSKTSEYMCRVVYSTEYGVSVPWFARWDAAFCVEKARELVNKQVNLGFVCNRQ